MRRLVGPSRKTGVVEALIDEDRIGEMPAWIQRRNWSCSSVSVHGGHGGDSVSSRVAAPTSSSSVATSTRREQTTPATTRATGPARGADDDGSGVAGTLALARWMWGMRGQLRHTVRFCFFNGEEQGLIGSKAYASALKAHGAPIRAVVCMDMVGYNSDTNWLFEVHAGYTDPAVRDASVPIANRIASWAACLGALPPAQIYQGTSASGGPDRLTSDGAINRSDHAAFHQQGYPAVVVTEDFFGNLASEPLADPNPNYHRNADAVVDAAYGAEIVCAVGYAVRALAS